MAEEKVDWDGKERRMVRMNALKHATDAVMFSQNDKTVLLQEIIDRVKNTATEYEDFVYNGLLNIKEAAKSETPLPTVAQKEWLTKINEKYNFNQETVYKNYGKYPSTQAEAKEAIKSCQ